MWIIMKNSKKFQTAASSVAKKLANSELRRNANSTTCGAIYQPKAPASLKKFSKVENDK